MCFCASASFIVGAGTAAAGAASLKYVKKEERPLILIPFLFTIQQIIEGIQWLIPHTSDLSLILGYAFLFFAFLLWPSYTPFAVYTLEQDPKRKKILKGLMVGGALTTLILLYTLLSQTLTIEFLPLGINYHIKVPFALFHALWYIFIVGASFFISSKPMIRLFGILLTFSGLASLAIFHKTFISVWCFFAAIISMLMYLYFRQQNRSIKTN